MSGIKTNARAKWWTIINGLPKMNEIKSFRNWLNRFKSSWKRLNRITSVSAVCDAWTLPLLASKKQGPVKNKFHDCSKDGSPQHKAAGCAQVGPNIGKFYALKKDQSDLVFGQGLTWYIWMDEQWWLCIFTKTQQALVEIKIAMLENKLYFRSKIILKFNLWTKIKNTP